MSNEIQEDCNPWMEMEETWRDVEIYPELDALQLNVVRQLLQEYSDMLSNIASRTTVIEHGIDTGKANRSGFALSNSTEFNKYCK
jgi:hypothetical protein